jgi:tRNA-dihydrouridine synthase 2
VIKNYEDIEKFKNDCGVTSVMVARAAMWNCTVFRKDGVLPLDDVIKRYLQIVRLKHFLMTII